MPRSGTDWVLRAIRINGRTLFPGSDKTTLVVAVRCESEGTWAGQPRVCVYPAPASTGIGPAQAHGPDATGEFMVQRRPVT